METANCVRAESAMPGAMRGFLESVERFSCRPALVCGNRVFTYSELCKGAGAMAGAILRYEERPGPLVALLACRSETAYMGVLAILGAGKGYVPLSPRFPAARSRKMAELSGCHMLIAGKECLAQLSELLRGFDRPMVILLPDTAKADDLRADFPYHRFVVAGEFGAADDFHCSPNSSPDAVAYLLFTSGSTGEPKGVPITQSNLRSYIDYVRGRYDVSYEDRFSQHSDLTFDLSAHDMFLAWECGAALYPIPERSLLSPAKFIRDHDLTVWFSVPSVVGMLKKLHLLSAGCLPSLRWSLFCGEPLPASYAQSWQEAAPASLIENLYGPTETTIAISHYRWNPAWSAEECRNGICPIGWTFTGQQSCLIDSTGNVAKSGESGELCLSGSQVSPGYWKDRAKTCERFIQLPHSGATVWYRTGDVARQDADGLMHCLGRTDYQIKIRGFRAELQEIEAVLRGACSTDQVVAVPWPVANGSAEGVVAFVAANRTLDQEIVLRYCRDRLPEYMVPRSVRFLDDLPLNDNRKIDRSSLLKVLERTEP